MNIKMYPHFSEVFLSDELIGIFYPLCTVNDNLHFVSSNGLWMDNQYETENNTFQYTKFELKNGKYDFNGDIRLYKGYEFAKKIIYILEKDFEANGNNYLKNKLKTNIYIEEIKKTLPCPATDDIDLKYYLQTFYEFSINKLNYNLNGKFGEFSFLINGYAKPDKSPIVYGKGCHALEETLQEKIDITKDYSEIGTVIGYEYFTDGNDTVLLFNEKENKVLSINCYS
jgi:hypothetical protein